ncbi:MAG: hypothetical protein A3K19_20090 [Lentisphaerae bacterium RIFOXYB12_FULL_65_16]|nr:MAG: hypothetical protein A3K18_11170 [Lentisphaerae bacterium RIFOXYA12_64_32]OGV91763.1 MAG: hypothetical protein A3K19_20090 [Lentisphaerae bacterium RIFOXYB12_FULL_65_16]
MKAPSTNPIQAFKPSAPPTLRPFDRLSSRSFTIVELLVVVAIIGILASLLLPALQQSREKANQSSCMGQTRQFALAFQQYADDWNDSLPPYVSDPDYKVWWYNNTRDYLGGNMVWRCPSQRLASMLDYGVIYSHTSGVAWSQYIKKMRYPQESAVISETEGQNTAAGRSGQLYLGYCPYNWAEGAIGWAYYRGIAWPGRHMYGNNSAYVDGHADFRRYTDIMTRARYWNH